MQGLPPDDRGLTLGDGLFETLLARDGQLVAFEAHLRRMAHGCGVLGLPEPDAVLALQLCLDALADAGLGAGRAAVRLTLTAGSGGRGLNRPATPAPRLFATAAPSPRPTTPAGLIIARARRNEGSPASRLKSLSYLDNVLARAEAAAAGADEAVMLNTRGQVACAGAANLFWLSQGRLCTPALQCGVLDGIVRRQVLTAMLATGQRAEEVAVGAEALASVQAMVLTNSLIGVRAVSSLEGRALDSTDLAQRLGKLAATLI